MTWRAYWILCTALLFFGVVGFVLYVMYKRAPKAPTDSSPAPIVRSNEDGRSLLQLATVLPDLEYADTESLRIQGLSGRESLRESAGLLFVFEEPALHGFWMKDMRFPIDMIWLDEAGMVVGLKEGATPASFPEVFYPRSPARYVLETNIGFIGNHHMKLGMLVLLPHR